jgi:hypothetical protein
LSIIVPILYGAVALGLFAPRLNRGTVVAAITWIVVVLIWYYANN